MRWFAIVLCALAMIACSSGPRQPTEAELEKTRETETKAAWYVEAVKQLQDLNRAAEEKLRAGNSVDAGKIVEKGTPVEEKVLNVSRPTLAAVEASADHDDLYGRMLLANKNYGWARILFQKNLARWKYWKFKTPESERRLALAQAQIAECDRHIVQ